MSTPARPDAFEFDYYVRALRRRWRIVAAVTLAGLLIAVAVVLIAPKRYTATTSVYVATLPTDTKPIPSTGGPVAMDTEAQLVQSHAVAKLAARQLNPTPTHLSQAVSVTVPPNTTLLDIACEQSSGASAAACANAVAAAYLSVRSANATSILTGQLAALRAKQNVLLPEVVRLNLELRRQQGTNTNAQAIQLQANAANAQLNALSGHVNSLTAQLASLQAPGNATAGHIVNAAAIPTSPSSPRTALLIPSGLVGGLIVGLVLGLWSDLRDDRLHDREDVERIHALPTVFDLRDTPAGRSAATAEAPASELSELAEFVAATPADGCLALLVAGDSAEQGVSAVALALAATLSRIRPDVYLVCAAPGSTLVPQYAGLEHSSGLAELLAGTATLDDVAERPDELPNLRVVGPGSVADLLRPDFDARRRLIGDLRSRGRFIVIESPLTRSSPPGLGLAEFADAAALVIETAATTRAAGTTRRDVNGWLRRLDRLRVPVLAAVLAPRADGPKPPAAAGLSRSRARQRARPTEAPEPAGVGAMRGQSAGMAEQQGTR